MNSQIQKQILIGVLAGALVVALTWILLIKGKQDELKVLEAANIVLQQEVDKGFQLKANYEKLKAEVEEQQKMIDALIKIMPTDTDRGEIPYRIKKISDSAGIEQIAFNVEGPVKKEYYTEYPFTFSFRAGYHTFGQMTSLISGYDKIINLKDLQFKRDPKNKQYPAAVTCKISAFVYNPEQPPPPPSQPSSAPAPGTKAKISGEGE